MTISTPCVAVCVLDETADLCLGCGRTRREIAGWRAMAEEARLALMARLPDRLAEHRRKTGRALAAGADRG